LMTSNLSSFGTSAYPPQVPCIWPIPSIAYTIPTLPL
jgi:hypothetical protein